MQSFKESEPHSNQEQFFERKFIDAGFTISHLAYHDILPNFHMEKLKLLNEDPTSLFIRAVPTDILVTKDNFSFFLEVKGNHTRSLEATALSIHYALAKLRMKIVYTIEDTKVFVLKPNSLEDIKTVYYHQQSNRKLDQEFIKSWIGNQNIKFEPKPKNGNSLDPFIYIDQIKDRVRFVDIDDFITYFPESLYI